MISGARGANHLDRTLGGCWGAFDFSETGLPGKGEALG